MTDLGPRAGTPSVADDPEPSDDPTIPVSAEVMAAAQKAAVAHLEARMAAQTAPGGKPAQHPPKPQRGARPTAPEDRVVAAARPPPQRLRGYREEDEKVIVAGVAVEEPSLSVDVDLDDALTPHMSPAYPPSPYAHAQQAGPPHAQQVGPYPPSYAPYAPPGTSGAEQPRRRRLASDTVELPRGAFARPPGPLAQAPSSNRALLYVAIAISSVAVLLLLANLLRR